MKIDWWQGGVHMRPLSFKEREALLVLTEGLGRQFVNVEQEIPTSPVVPVESGDQEPVV